MGFFQSHDGYGCRIDESTLMELIEHLINFFLHLDKYLLQFVATYGVWTYVLLFSVIFCETGLVITPFLPGDSLLFIAGAIASHGVLNAHVLVALLIIAAILGDTVNYWIGNRVGHKIFDRQPKWFFKQEHFDYTHRFFQRHGGKTIIIARFVPIVRTFAPFVAGVGRMNYRWFLSYNVIGAIIWVSLLTYAGYFFGNIPIIKNNLTLVIIGIIILSIMPGVIEYLRSRSN